MSETGIDPVSRAGTTAAHEHLTSLINLAVAKRATKIDPPKPDEPKK